MRIPFSNQLSVLLLCHVWQQQVWYTSAQTLVWSDEFNGTRLDERFWSYELGSGVDGWGNQELQVYTKDNSNVRVENDLLKIIAQQHANADGTRRFTSGRIKTQSKMSFQYGTLIAKINNPNIVAGLWPAFWTMGQIDNVKWPAMGEIDIMELGWRGRNNRIIYSAAHWEHQDTYALWDGNITAPSNLNGTFFTYKMEWTKERITTFVDNQQIWAIDIRPEVCTDCEEFHRPHYIILSLAVGGGFTTDNTNCGGSSAVTTSSGGCAFRTDDDISATFPAEMAVDWIRLYSYGITITNITTLPPAQSEETRRPTTRPVALSTAAPTTPKGPPANVEPVPVVKPVPCPTIRPTMPKVQAQETRPPTRSPIIVAPPANVEPVPCTTGCKPTATESQETKRPVIVAPPANVQPAPSCPTCPCTVCQSSNTQPLPAAKTTYPPVQQQPGESSSTGGKAGKSGKSTKGELRTESTGTSSSNSKKTKGESATEGTSTSSSKKSKGELGAESSSTGSKKSSKKSSEFASMTSAEAVGSSAMTASSTSSFVVSLGLVTVGVLLM